MIFCIKYESLVPQAVQDEHAVMCPVYEAIDLLLSKSNMKTQIQKEDSHEHLLERCEGCIAFINLKC